MDRKPTVRIEGEYRKTNIFVDDRVIDSVTGFNLFLKKNGETPVLKLDIPDAKIPVALNCVPELPEPYSRFYKAKL